MRPCKMPPRWDTLSSLALLCWYKFPTPKAARLGPWTESIKYFTEKLPISSLREERVTWVHKFKVFSSIIAGKEWSSSLAVEVCSRGSSHHGRLGGRKSRPDSPTVTHCCQPGSAFWGLHCLQNSATHWGPMLKSRACGDSPDWKHISFTYFLDHVGPHS